MNVINFALFNDNLTATDEDRCVNWQANTVDLADYEDEFLPCPCNLQQANAAGSFFTLENLPTRQCFATTKAVNVRGYGVVRRVSYIKLHLWRKQRHYNKWHLARQVDMQS